MWCLDSCELPLARRLNAHFDSISKEMRHFWYSEDSKAYLKGVGAHTTSFDELIKGNGSWQDIRLWRGRGFNHRLCERFFRVTCGLIEASPEVWTNPWSHVLISILMPDSWVPFHQGHTNGQLTYHLPVMLPEDGAELALLHRAGALDERETRSGRFGPGVLFHRTLSRPEEVAAPRRCGDTCESGDALNVSGLLDAWEDPGL